MKEAKFSSLCSHYKDTFDIHLSAMRRRDILFYWLLVMLSLFALQISSTEMVVSIVSEYTKQKMGINIDKNANFISALLWLLLLGGSIKYYQVNTEIERQYDYLHTLENSLNAFYPRTAIFTREGKSYLNNYPLFSNWVNLLYKFIFPGLILVSIIVRICNQLATGTNLASVILFAIS
jgi:hypothetical protein